MATEEVVTLTCDQPAMRGHQGRQLEEGTETISFEFGPNAYETELCPRHSTDFRGLIAHYAQHARRTGRTGARRHPGARRQPTRSIDVRRHSAEIRSWARQQGIPVSDRGRIPDDVLEQWQAAH